MRSVRVHKKKKIEATWPVGIAGPCSHGSVRPTAFQWAPKAQQSHNSPAESNRILGYTRGERRTAALIGKLPTRRSLARHESYEGKV